MKATSKKRYIVQYWYVMLDCLTEFLGQTEYQALEIFNKYVIRCGGHTNTFNSICYHAEPSNVAEHLIDTKIEWNDELQKRYNEIKNNAFKTIR